MPGVKNYAPEDAQKATRWVQDIVQHWSQKFGFISYSKHVNDPVLWGHYAQKHTGVAFELSRRSDPDVLREIKYTINRPTIDIQKFQQLRSDPVKLAEYLNPLLIKLFEHKAPSWSYEGEYRDVLDLTKSEFFELQDGHYHIRIEDGVLVRVILGCHCKLDEAYLGRTLKQAGLHSAKVVRAKLSASEYKVIF